jgi:hypothetical protein
MKRYAIMVCSNYPGAPLTELCQVDTDPEAIKQAAQKKTLTLDIGAGRKVRQPKYCHVEIVERTGSLWTTIE